jgi:5-methyltetrahydrofolate--homocysteine methyltransferase
VPVLLGGAALSRHYCESELRSVYQGHVYYGRDAFEGLRTMDYLVNGRAGELDAEIDDRLGKRAAVEQRLARGGSSVGQEASGATTATAAVGEGRSAVRTDVDIPKPPFWGSRVVEGIRLDDVYPFINKVALFRGQWQFKKGRKTDAEYEAQLEDEVEPIFLRLAAQCRDERVLQPKVAYGYFPCASEGNDLIVYDPVDHQREIERFTFPRQRTRRRLCISDFFRPVESGQKDTLALMCVTVGGEASRRAKALFEANNYAEYLYLHGFGVECAEALAEFWHKRIRQELGIAGEDSPHIRELFTQHYRGSRYSFGYPACPQMSDQEKLFGLIDPSRIGCVLTENWQIDPEQSTSAVVAHHPEAKYFNV